MESKCPDETAHVQDIVNLHILRMLEYLFSLDAAHNIDEQRKHWSDCINMKKYAVRL